LTLVYPLDDELAAKLVLGKLEDTSGASGSHSTLEDRRVPDGAPMFVDEAAIAKVRHNTSQLSIATLDSLPSLGGVFQKSEKLPLSSEKHVI
jgi:hypothetical protein